jgi:hypothetical protein
MKILPWAFMKNLATTGGEEIKFTVFALNDGMGDKSTSF